MLSYDSYKPEPWGHGVEPICQNSAARGWYVFERYSIMRGLGKGSWERDPLLHLFSRYHHLEVKKVNVPESLALVVCLYNSTDFSWLDTQRDLGVTKPLLSCCRNL